MKRFLLVTIIIVSVFFLSVRARAQTSVTPTITTGTVTGTISACQGSPSTSPNIQQFTVSGSGLTNDITATAPTGFEASLSASGVYGSAVIIPQLGGTVNNTVVYVRSAASATGSVSGNVVLTSPGANAQNVAVTGKINPLPTVNSVGDQTFVAGTNTTAINFTGTANTFTWTSSNPAIGLPASGTGNIPVFAAVNNGTAPITSTVTVVPTSKAFAYIASGGSDKVSVINTVTNTYVTTIPVGFPAGVAVSLSNGKVYVTDQNSSAVTVINTSTNTVDTAFGVGKFPFGIAVSPDGSKLYVANQGDNTVSVINAKTYALITTVKVGNNPYGITVSPDGSKVYVTNLGGVSVSVINSSTNKVMTTIPVGPYPNGITSSPDGSRVYVANTLGNSISVINTITNSVISTIAVGSYPIAVVTSIDGKNLYVTNAAGNSLWVIDITTNTVINKIPVGNSPEGISITPDGQFVYVVNEISNDVSVINTQTYEVITQIGVGLNPVSLGNFVLGGTGCTGVPITFTITINSTPPTITTTAIMGTISACQGSASVSPHVGQFTVSGNSLTNGIVATAPPGFQLSLSATGVYSNIVSIPQSGGTVNNVTIYVGLAASATGNISGNVTLTSSGATDKSVTVTGTVNALPTVNHVPNQIVASGNLTSAVHFTGTASNYNWVDDNGSIGVIPGGSPGSDIVPFIATNTGNTPVISTFTVTPINTTTGCSGIPTTFTIEVDPILPAVIAATGTLSPLSTIYGTPSTSTSFSVSGSSMNAGILVTPPAGFEVSTDNTHFSQTLTVGSSGTITATTVYIRLTSKTPVSSYSGNVILSSAGATNVNVFVPYSIVNPAPLTITANNVQKRSGQTLTNSFLSTGFTSSGMQNNETIGGVFMVYGPGADAAAKAGTYTGSVVPSVASGGSFDPKNYTITYKPGDIIVIEAISDQPIAIPNAFTPNGDGINDVWNIAGLIDYPSCMVSIFTRYGTMIYQSKGYAKPWDGLYNSNPLPTGTYYYVINLQNGQQPLSGYVALIR